MICPHSKSSRIHGGIQRKTQNYLLNLDRTSKHVYLVPKRCVEWRSMFHTNRVYYKTLTLTLKLNLSKDGQATKHVKDLGIIKCGLLHNT